MAAAECHEALGDVGRARREYLTALALDPTLSVAYDRLDRLDQSEHVARAVGSDLLRHAAPAGAHAAPPARPREAAAVAVACPARAGEPLVSAGPIAPALPERPVFEAAEPLVGAASASLAAAASLAGPPAPPPGASGKRPPKAHVVLRPEVLARVSRDGDPLVVLVADDEDLCRKAAPAWNRVNLDSLVAEALGEARALQLASAG
jgi:hypothetical protein